MHLANNSITNIVGLEDNHPFLGCLDLSNNFLDDAEEIGVFFDIRAMRDLKLMGNPLVPESLAEKVKYRLRTLHILSRLTILDGMTVTSEEKVAALNMFAPPGDVVAAIHHCNLVKRHIKQYAKIKAVDLMQSNRLRPIVLCGPSGVGKRYA